MWGSGSLPAVSPCKYRSNGSISIFDNISIFPTLAIATVAIILPFRCACVCPSNFRTDKESAPFSHSFLLHVQALCFSSMIFFF